MIQREKRITMQWRLIIFGSMACLASGFRTALVTTRTAGPFIQPSVMTVTGDSSPPTYFRRIRFEKKVDNFSFYKSLSSFRTSGRSASSSSLSSMAVDDGDTPPISAREPSIKKSVLTSVTAYAPLWTIISAMLGLAKADAISPTLGALSTVEPVLATLMLAMGLVITPTELSQAIRSPGILALNALCCFGMMPLLSLFLSNHILHLPVQQTVGLVLLGSVSGGQASNLFTLLAGGNVALSVVCTLSTTLLGVMMTPLLVQWLLGSCIMVDGIGVLRSVMSLVLVPLVSGLAMSRFQPKITNIIKPFCPAIGVFATSLLVAGGAANSAGSLLMVGGDWKTIVAASLWLPILGGTIALGLVSIIKTTTMKIPETSKRTLVVEVLSKSPTLAYVLARKHFSTGAASIPAASMVSLAIVGAAVASLWTTVSPIQSTMTKSNSSDY